MYLPFLCFTEAALCVGEGPWMVIIAMDAADVARTADNSDGVGVTCCRHVGDRVCDTSSPTAVVSTPCPFDLTGEL